jgi:hypothetical protein
MINSSPASTSVPPISMSSLATLATDDIHGAGGPPGELHDEVIVWSAKAYADRFGNQAVEPSAH